MAKGRNDGDFCLQNGFDFLQEKGNGGPVWGDLSTARRMTSQTARIEKRSRQGEGMMSVLNWRKLMNEAGLLNEP